MRTFSLLSLSLIGAVAALATPITSLSSAAAHSPVQSVMMNATPEPATIGMIAVGLSVLALKLRRRK